MKRQLMLIVTTLAVMLVSVSTLVPGASSDHLRVSARAVGGETAIGNLTMPQATEERKISVVMKVACGDEDIKSQKFFLQLEKGEEYVECRKPPSPKREPPGREDICGCKACEWNPTTRKVSAECHCKKHPECGRESDGIKPASSLDMAITVMVKKTNAPPPEGAPNSPRKP